jgi:predicted  nucleic acid-binding Zn-ribbon protein
MAAQGGQDDVISRLNNNARRIRKLEETTRNLQEQVKNIEDRLNNQKKRVSQNKKELSDDVEKLDETVQNLNAEIKKVQRKTRKLVTRREFNEIEEYIDLMNPIESDFMTKEEVNELLDERLGQTQET